MKITKPKTLTAIAQAIRAKRGHSNLLRVAEMAPEIRLIDGASGVYVDPDTWRQLIEKDLYDGDADKVVVPEGVAVVGYHSFSYLPKTKTIDLPSTLVTFPNNSQMTNGSPLIETMIYRCDFSSGLYAPNISSLKNIYVPTKYLANYQTSTAVSHYFKAGLVKPLRDADLTELVLVVPDFLVPGASIVCLVSYNADDDAKEEQRGVIWSVSGPAAIDESGALAIDEDAPEGATIEVTAVSTYNPSISATSSVKVMGLLNVELFKNGVVAPGYSFSDPSGESSGGVKLASNSVSITNSSYRYGWACCSPGFRPSGYTRIVFNGKISSTNGELGHVFITKYPDSKQTSGGKIGNEPVWAGSVKLATSTKDYIIDLTSLDLDPNATYYIGFGGSARTVTCYSLELRID